MVTHTLKGLVFRCLATPLPQVAWTKHSPILGSLYLCIYPLTQSYKIWPNNTHGDGVVVVFKWWATPPPPGACSQRSPILGVPFYWCVHSLSQNYQIWRGNTCRVGVSHASHTKRAESCVSQTLGFAYIHAYILLTQNHQIRHGNTYREWYGLRLSTPLCLHKCVARFVSDSWVSCL